MNTINALFINHKDINRFKSLFGSSEYHVKKSSIWIVDNCKFKDRILYNLEIDGSYCPYKDFSKKFFGCYNYNDDIEIKLNNKKIRYKKITLKVEKIDHKGLYYKSNISKNFHCKLTKKHKEALSYFGVSIPFEECLKCIKCSELAKKDLEEMSS